MNRSTSIRLASSLLTLVVFCVLPFHAFAFDYTLESDLSNVGIIAELGLDCVSTNFHFDPWNDNARDRLREALYGEIQSTYDSFKAAALRIKSIDPSSALKPRADAKLSDSKDSLKKYLCYDLKDEPVAIPGGFQPSAQYESLKADAKWAVNDLQTLLVAPVMPGASKAGESGTVPKGDLTSDFLPYVIRMLLRLASLAALVGLVTAGSLLVFAYDNDEYVTKAKRILYYSLMGFAFVALAYAIVSAVTKINFFAVL